MFANNHINLNVYYTGFHKSFGTIPTLEIILKEIERSFEEKMDGNCIIFG